MFVRPPHNSDVCRHPPSLQQQLPGNTTSGAGSGIGAGAGPGNVEDGGVGAAPISQQVPVARMFSPGTAGELRQRGAARAQKPRPQYVPVEDGFVTTVGNKELAAKYGNATGLSVPAVPPTVTAGANVPPPPLPVAAHSDAGSTGVPASQPSPTDDALAAISTRRSPVELGVSSTLTSSKSD